MFSILWKFRVKLHLLPANDFRVDKAKILSFGKGLALSRTNHVFFSCLQYKFFENTVGKGEIAGYKQFLLFPSVFYLFEELSAIFIKFEIVVCKLFQFVAV